MGVKGRHRSGGNGKGGRLAIAAAAVVLAVITLGWVGVRTLGGNTCGTTSTLSVTASPDIAPAVADVGRAYTSAHHRIDGACVAISVAAVDPVEVTAVVADKAGAVLNGVGKPNRADRAPQVWIPDSSVWLNRLRAAAPAAVPSDAPSVASSPVVLAMPEPVASAFGWPGKQPGWQDLLTRLTSGSQINVGTVEPTRDAAGLGGLLALRAAAATAGAQGQQALVGGLRALAAGRSTIRADLLSKFPRGSDQASIAAGLAVAALPESAVIGYNASQPPVPLAALYPSPGAPSLDFPYAVMPGESANVKRAADDFRGALADARNTLAKHGLRAADGTAGSGFPAGHGVPSTAVAPVKLGDVAAVEETLSTWTAVTLPARMLAVIDVSGSMAEPVPTAGNASREQVTIGAATRGLGLFDDSWAVGLWTFSTLLDGTKDYRQLVPIGPLATQRSQVAGALATIQPKPDGQTGLYDTVLAAYKTVQAGWDPSKVNSVVILTDGQNEDPNGIDLPTLLATLKKIADPDKPIQVIAIGIGDQIDEVALKKITDTTGGGTFTTADPAKIGDIFLRAIALRTQIVK